MTVCYFCGGKDTLADIGKELDDGKYKMVKCKKCKTAYYVVNKEKMNKQKPPTNEEYMQTCNAEELGCFICENFFHGVCGECRFCEKTELRHHCMLGKWLKEKHDGV